MDQHINKYVGQQLKNKAYKKKHNRRVSSILSQMKFATQEDQQVVRSSRLEQLEEITNQLKGGDEGFKSRKESLTKRSSLLFTLKKQNRKSSLLSNRFSQQSSTNLIFRIKPPKKMSTFGHNQQFGQLQKIRSAKKNLLKQQKQKIQKIHLKKNLHKKCPSINLQCSIKEKSQGQLEVADLQSQNIHKLNSFIRGAYDNQIYEFSDVVNLSMIDQTRRDFYVFNRLYDEIVQANMNNKVAFRDIKQQNLKEIVFINEQKNHATSPEFLMVLKQLKVIR